MLRVSERTRDRVMQVAAGDFGGATVEETLNRLLDEHWEAQAIAAMDRFGPATRRAGRSTSLRPTSGTRRRHPLLTRGTSKVPREGSDRALAGVVG